MLELRQVLWQRLGQSLSEEQKQKYQDDLRYISSALSKEFNIPRSALFMLKDSQTFSNALAEYVKKM